MPVLSFDIGGTGTRVALVDGAVVLERAQVVTPRPATPDAVLAAAVALAAPLAGRADAVGVACAGAVTDGHVTATAVATFPGWTDVPLAPRITSALGLPARVLNDARAAAWGEARAGAGRGVSEFMFVTVSTGVGAGLVLGGRLHLAANGLDAELGFTYLPLPPWDEDGGVSPEPVTLTGVGTLAALEHQASGTALGRAATRLGLPGARELADAALLGDPAGAAIVQRSAALVAWRCADAAALLGVTRVALGGSVGLRPEYLHQVREALGAFPARYRPEVRAAELGGDAGLIGAALWAWEPS
ncbi:ROK family protein [Deinococcus aquiradiocola]|uniref:N-acetylmannosamine kinase n=1 Tax=Deinococcus aquiradiocola TaxID=393059 RepID=A0A917PGY0_9DEIO|nr:ROK family protein [Deinococcus aquiradiocola]GGJ77126.1 N-acetylmannosamine kinase [Deinococcus aquiradiocola]